MKKFNQEKTTERFRQLPDSVQNVILSEKLADALHKAMHSAKLSESDIKTCNQQATLVMVGFSTTSEFQKYIKSELPLGAGSAETLFDDIKSNVFNHVRKALMEILNNNPAQSKRESTSETDPYKEQLE